MSETKRYIHIVALSNRNLIAVSNCAGDLVSTLWRRAPECANAETRDTIMRTIEAQRHAVDDKHVEIVERQTLDNLDVITTIYNDPEHNPYPFAVSGGEPDEVIERKMREMATVMNNAKDCKMPPACGSDIIKNMLGQETMVMVINAQRFMTDTDTTFVVDYDKMKAGL